MELTGRRSGTVPPEPPGLAAMAQAINDVAKTARTLLTALLAVAITLAATMIAATDEAIFRDAAKVFPSLGVEIRLSTAYALAPPLFLFLHVNALLQLHLLAQRLRAFEDVLDRAGYLAEEKVLWRGQIHGIAFAQTLTGEGGGNGDGWMYRTLLSFVTWLAVVAVPVLLLLTAQVSFVRYQSVAITAVHIVALAADLVVLVWFRDGVLRQAGLGIWWVRLRRGAAAAAIVVVAGLSWTQALPPPPEVSGGNVFDALSKVQGFHWTRRWLDLSGLTLINTEAKPDLLAPFGGGDERQAEMRRKMVVLALPGRSFVWGNFSKAQLFAINLRGADLRVADFNYAQLNGAYLGNTRLIGSSFYYAQLKGAIFGNAHLEGAIMGGAHLEGANLGNAHLEGAEIGGAHLEGAYLNRTHLQGALVVDVHLEGANIRNSELNGADIGGAHLRGATIRGTAFALATGTPSGCNSSIMDRPVPKDAMSPTALDETLKSAGVTDARRGEIRDRVKTQPLALCEGQPLTLGRPLPSPPAYAAALRDAACASPDVAKGILRTDAAEGVLNTIKDQTARDILPLFRAAGARLAEPAGDDCPGLRGLSAELADVVKMLATASPTP